MTIAKAVVAAILSGLTVLATVYSENVWIAVAMAVLTTIGVYLVPNAEVVTDKREPLV